MELVDKVTTFLVEFVFYDTQQMDYQCGPQYRYKMENGLQHGTQSKIHKHLYMDWHISGLYKQGD